MKTLLLSAALFISGCATAPQMVPPETQLIDHPTLNTEAVAEIGETLVSKGVTYVFDGLDLLERVTDGGFAREYIVEPGPMRLERVDLEGDRYFVPGMDSYFVNDKTFGRKVRPSNAYMVLKKDGTLELRGFYDLSSAGEISPTMPRHRVGKIIDKGRPNFRQELIYGGRAGNQIRLTYREFSSDMIRPGFTQEAQYDLSDDQTIGFKGARLDIVSATNTRLTYRVRRSFPDMP